MIRPRKDSESKRSSSSSSKSTDTEPEKKRRPVNIYRTLIHLFFLMAGQSRKWMILVATIWIQAFTGTNFDFSAYSSDLKSVLGVSQVQLNYLATASDLGKLFGWLSGLALMYFPLWVVLFMAAFMGFFGYGLQWLVISHVISLPYILVCVCVYLYVTYSLALFFLIFDFDFISVFFSFLFLVPEKFRRWVPVFSGYLGAVIFFFSVYYFIIIS